MDELVRLLSVERRLLELLLFKLVEMERARDRVHDAELRRAMLVNELAAEMGVPDEALMLSVLARDCAEPFRTMFADHQLAFSALAAEIEATPGLALPSLVDFLR